MSNRIIINNRTDLSDLEALEYVKQVIEMGRNSNNGKQYCCLTAFGQPHKYHVVTDLRKKSDSFIIYDVPKQTHETKRK